MPMFGLGLAALIQQPHTFLPSCSKRAELPVGIKPDSLSSPALVGLVMSALKRVANIMTICGGGTSSSV